MPITCVGLRRLAARLFGGLCVAACLSLIPTPAEAQSKTFKPLVPKPTTTRSPFTRYATGDDCNHGGNNGGNGNSGRGGLGWIVGGGYYGPTQPQYVPVPQPYPVQPEPEPGYIPVPPSAYTTISIPSASGDGRQLVVDIIRGARDDAPGKRVTEPQLAATRNEEAAAALNLLKPDLPAEKLLEFLILPDERVQLQALELLLARGDAGLEALRQGAGSTNPDLRAAALACLTHAAANPQRLALAGDVLPMLYDALGDSSVQVRRIAAGGVGLLAPVGNAELTVKRLMALLRDPDDEVRGQAVRSLSWMKEAAVAPLIEAISSQSDQLRNAASEALGLIGPPALPHLMAALQNPRAEVRYSAASALGDLGGAAAAAAPALRKLAKDDKDSNVRYYAAASLRKIDR